MFAIASQSIKIDMLVALLIEQFSASKDIVYHTLELTFGVLSRDMLLRNNFTARV